MGYKETLSQKNQAGEYFQVSGLPASICSYPDALARQAVPEAVAAILAFPDSCHPHGQRAALLVDGVGEEFLNCSFNFSKFFH